MTTPNAPGGLKLTEEQVVRLQHKAFRQNNFEVRCFCLDWRALRAACDEKDAEIARYQAALEKIDAIRNSIIGFQTVNWSEHIYPLVAALGEAGFEGDSYENSRKNVGTLLEQINAAEARLAAMATVTEADASYALSVWFGVAEVPPDGWQWEHASRERNVKTMRAALEAFVANKTAGGV